MILTGLINKLGDSNPQIFRELKERLTLRNIGIAVVATFLIQGFVLLYFNGQIPIPSYETFPVRKLIQTYSSYCVPEKFSAHYNSTACGLNEAGEYNINWQKWWSDVFTCLSWILPLGLILGSVYMLVADLVQEEKRGTLNFIRLSPQSAQKIFIGKISGVPILVYLAAALMLPMHLLVGFTAGASLTLLLSWYAAIGSIWFLFASAAVLYVLLGGIQAIVTAMAVSYPVGLIVLAINAFASATIENESWLGTTGEHLSWFGMPIAGSALWFYTFGIGCCLVASYWVWQALERRYLNPTATVVSKSQSYFANLCLQVWMAGFVLPQIPRDTYSKESTIAGFAVMDFMALLLLIPMLLPSKQAVQDWSRHRRERGAHQHRQFWQRDLFKDLVNNDKSPALLAIAMNIGMAMVLWLPVSIVAFDKPSHGMRFLAGACLAASLILIYAAIAHLGLFLKFKKRNLWIVAIVAGAMILPLVGAFVLSPNHTPTGLAAVLLLFSPLAPIGIVQLAGSTILATFAAQLVMLGALTRQFQRKLQVSGQSQTKELLAQS
jgi:hypothetical protein